MPPPAGQVPQSIDFSQLTETYRPIETEYEQENIIRKDVDCRMPCPRSQHWLQKRLIRRTFVAGGDMMNIWWF